MPQDLLESLLQQEEFSRKSRIPSLYSDFSPLLLSNKDGYEANIKAWLSALSRAIYDSPGIESHLTIHANQELADALISHQWGKPLALPTIEAEARSRRAWIPCDEFMTSTVSLYTPPSIVKSSLTSLLSWGVSKVWSSRPPTRMTQTRYVLVSNLERLVKSIQKARANNGSSLYSDDVTSVDLLTTWIAKTCDVTLTAHDMQLLLTYLSRDKDLIRVSGDTVKWSSSGEVSESDIAVSQLKSTIASQARQIAAFDALHNELSALLKTQLDSKVLAMSTMRRRKSVEKRLEECTKRYGECCALLDKIDEGVQQLGTLEGMERASAALGRVLTQIGGLERVERVIDQVREQSDQVEEIGQAMASTSLDDDVDEEYAALLASTTKEDDAISQTVAQLPDAPSHDVEGKQKQEDKGNSEEKQATELKREAISA